MLFTNAFFGAALMVTTPRADAADGGPPPVRDRNNVMGMPDVPDIHKRELLQANEIVRRTANLLQTAHAAGAEYILEHPADRGDF
eukprot:3984729-Pleurochrysis_carterae.AAC.1